ncbi:hypothetical protein G6F68_011650 [Rhizopus microsporus]|nr:hypothetical protein G6F68_011650 [Rhizopus microsporus]
MAANSRCCRAWRYHRQHRHRAPETHQPAYRSDCDGARRRRFHRGVPLFLRCRAEHRRKFRLGATRVPRRTAQRWPGLHQGHGVPAWPGVGAHLLPPYAGRRPAAGLPLVVRWQDEPDRCDCVCAAVREWGAEATALAAALGEPGEWAGRHAGVLVVRQPDTDGPAGAGMKCVGGLMRWRLD